LNTGFQYAVTSRSYAERRTSWRPLAMAATIDWRVEGNDII
jgi:hypothetical protein